MKTQIISAISGCLFSLMVVSSASAQQPETKVLPPVTINPTKIDVSPRALKAFNRSFADAENVKWYTRDKRFMVKFDQDEMNHHAVYMKSGYQVYHIGYGFENNLPANVKKQVKSQYGGYSITRSYTVDQDNQSIWVVSLQSPEEIITAGIAEGQIREISRMQNVSTASEPITTMIKKK